MARVTVMALEPVAERLGGPGEKRAKLQEEVSEAETLEGLVRRLTDRSLALSEITFSPAGAIVPGYRVLVNGTRIPFHDWGSYVLKDGDRIVFRRKS
jgi:molybdopterin converting factor small subunit